MRKIWKDKWWYYVVIFLISVCWMLSCTFGYGLFPVYHMLDWAKEVVLLNVYSGVEEYAEIIMYSFLNSGVFVVAGIVLLLCFLNCMQEHNRESQEFMECLPVTRAQRIRFHLCMDILTVFFSVVLFGVYGYKVISDSLCGCDVELPWLKDSFVGLTLVLISFGFMLLGACYVICNLTVSAKSRFLGTTSIIGMLFIMFMGKCGDSRLVQSIYGFFALKSVGNSYYMENIPEEYNNFLLYDTNWVHKRLQPTILYQNEALKLEDGGWDFYLSRLFDFSHPSSYIGYVIGYLVIAALLLGIGAWMNRHRELSKDVFYYEAGRYVYSIVIAVTSFLIMWMGTSHVWQTVLAIAASLLIGVFFLSALKGTSWLKFK